MRNQHRSLGIDPAAAQPKKTGFMSLRPQPKAYVCTATMAAAVVLQACSGGGGGSSGDSNSSFSTVSEIDRSYAVKAVNADTAYSLGYTGAGIAVAVIDTGADVTNSELSGALHPRSWSVVSNTFNTSDSAGHGTAVASVIAAARDSAGMMGIAYDASILAIKADSPSGSFQSGHLRQAIDYAVQEGAPIINMSLAGASAPGAGFYTALDEAVDQGTLFVIAAGNSAAINPEYPARYAGQFSGPGQILAVGSVNSSNQMSSFSSKAGNRKDYYLVAPGEGITVSKPGNSIETENGTSFAAPVVAGAASILKQQASHLTGRQIGDILLQTATDLGVPGVDEIYGHGLLDIATALQPFGVTIVPSSTTVVPEDPNDFNAAAGAIIYFDPAFGKALLRSEALDSVMALDEYGRAYNFDLSDMTVRAEHSIDMLQWLQSDLSELAYRTSLDPAGSRHLEWGMTPIASDRKTLTDGRYLAISSSDRFGGYRASVGLNSSTALGYSAIQTDAGKIGRSQSLTAIRSVARHAAEIPFLSFTGQSATGAITAKLSDRLSFRLAAGSNRTLAEPKFAGDLSGDDFEMMDPENDAITRLLNDTSSDVVAGEAQFKFSPKFSLSFTGGRLTERGSLLNSQAAGSLGFEGDAETVFGGVTALYQARGNLQFFGGYNTGRTTVGAQSQGLVRSITPVRSSAFTLGMTRTGILPQSLLGQSLLARGGTRNITDGLTLTISQPLRVESGVLNLDVPTARDEEGNITRIQEQVSLSPTGRQLDLFGAYDLRWNGRAISGVVPESRLSIIGGVTRHPGHDASASEALSVGIKYRQSH